jgi:hypothetical protein
MALKKGGIYTLAMDHSTLGMEASLGANLFHSPVRLSARLGLSLSEYHNCICVILPR